MRLSSELLLLAVSILLMTILSINGAPSSGGGDTSSEIDVQKRTNFTVEKLFDFQFYKKLFHKSYSSWREQVVRAKYFISRSIRVVISAWKYSNREQNHFLAINHMSDYSQTEIDDMCNKALDKRQSANRGKCVDLENNSEPNTNKDDSLPEFAVADGENAYETLTKLVEARKNEPFYSELLELLKSYQETDNPNRAQTADRIHELAQAHKGLSSDHDKIANKLDKLGRTRQKRDLTPTKDETNGYNNRPKRNVPLAKLINLGTGESLPVEVASKIAILGEIEGKNPKHTTPELFSQGVADQQVPLEMLELHSNFDDVGSYLEKLSNKYRPRQTAVNQQQMQVAGESIVTDSGSSSADNASSSDQPNEVFVDLRDSNCFVLPRDQGKCGSCYAFSAIAMMEYMHCKRTGQVVLFSEQYVIDCGRQYLSDYVFGCNGGISERIPEFFQQFGLELRSYYPYLRREDECPYDDPNNLAHAGYLRVDVGPTFRVGLARFASLLKLLPILVVVRLDDEFTEYGGGVHLARCNEKSSSHAMLLIGHGREDNDEYWLMRNSYSVSWGEGGYYKISKRSECISENEGYIFGTNDGKHIDLQVETNDLHDEDLILDHYMDRLI